MMPGAPKAKVKSRIVLTPQHAKILAGKGWTKQDIKAFISRYAVVPSYHMPTYWGTSNPLTIPGQRPGLFKGKIPMRETDTVPLISDSESISILVAGGAGAFIGLMMPMGVFASKKTTQKVELPKNWTALVKKYKEVVPTYIKY